MPASIPMWAIYHNWEWCCLDRSLCNIGQIYLWWLFVDVSLVGHIYTYYLYNLYIQCGPPSYSYKLVQPTSNYSYNVITNINPSKIAVIWPKLAINRGPQKMYAQLQWHPCGFGWIFMGDQQPTAFPTSLLPSGKLLHNYGKSHFFMGKSWISYKWPCSIAMLNYQRVLEQV